MPSGLEETQTIRGVNAQDSGVGISLKPGGRSLASFRIAGKCMYSAHSEGSWTILFGSAFSYRVCLTYDYYFLVIYVFLL